jgi:hypothetical protein
VGDAAAVLLTPFSRRGKLAQTLGEAGPIPSVLFAQHGNGLLERFI